VFLAQPRLVGGKTGRRRKEEESGGRVHCRQASVPCWPGRGRLAAAGAGRHPERRRPLQALLRPKVQPAGAVVGRG
jgi:hypothetical protein